MKDQTTPTQRALLRELRTALDNDRALRSMIGHDARQLPGMIVDRLEFDDWASLTFVGERHSIGFRFDGGAASTDAIRERLGQLLIARDFVVPGRIVADIAATVVTAAGRGVAVTVEALTLSE